MFNLAVLLLKGVAFLAFCAGIVAAIVMGEGSALIAFGAFAAGATVFSVLWVLASIAEDLRRIAGEPDTSTQRARYGFPVEGDA